jgi:hypothetical protein
MSVKEQTIIANPIALASSEKQRGLFVISFTCDSRLQILGDLKQRDIALRPSQFASFVLGALDFGLWPLALGFVLVTILELPTARRASPHEKQTKTQVQRPSAKNQCRCLMVFVCNDE